MRYLQFVDNDGGLTVRWGVGRSLTGHPTARWTTVRMVYESGYINPICQYFWY